ncbi:MAG: alpha-amylase family glycosyl hydrolase, partial [Candidatus Auribacterota bacterium]|nr:alpha-amylase family glycosyl hydrolase [Candidatus Auribacterota bacterium]
GYHQGRGTTPPGRAGARDRAHLDGGGGGGDDYRAGYGSRAEYEHFSADLDWMPRVVLMVKNSYVWLDQLSKRYHRRISRLDQIPDEELDRLARWGFTGFWLIGIWERSPASREIKRRCGNPEADASAYSLYDYVIASDLGGEKALRNLKDRAWRRGIRLASDMVPNHVGIYSKWVIEHPHWFIRSPHPPFPGYRFTGPNLSKDSRMEIYLEDGYWKRSDAAVVFKRVDRETGEVWYIYHGNDGTSMPWNDTAQIDFLQDAVREVVIQTILHVARSFPIIRFDAAMVLAKQHFQRLWYPPPGEGGAIPSRAGRGVSRGEFNRLFPIEFWREVVDRVAREVPETLLLAEAFWMLEGYFVRTLGMHRVYNSAFMNMLKLEMNDQYRQVVKEVLEFEPGILKRFVNFMNNPDEATAVAQFGKGDKYFGICTMLVTMPGLPLFGHGQIEGLTEKYGMEYRKAYWDEPIDEYLVKRHEEEIFPLMKKRHLFSDVTNFYLYDFYLEDGTVNEDVFAYSNRYENERSLIVYNNRFCNTNGWIRLSASRVENGRGGRKKMIQVDISRGLALRAADNDFTILKDLRSDLEYIRSSREIREKGLYFMLRAYQTHVFADIREVRDDGKGFLAALCESLNGRGVDNINDALKKVHFAPLYQAFQAIFNPDVFRRLFALSAGSNSLEALSGEIKKLITIGLQELLGEVLALRGKPRDVTRLIDHQVKYETAIALLVPENQLLEWSSSQ